MCSTNGSSIIGKIQEKAYVRVLFEKRCLVTLLKQGSTADIFLGNSRLF